MAMQVNERAELERSEADPPEQPFRSLLPDSAGRNFAAMLVGDLIGRCLVMVAFVVIARAVGSNAFGQLNLAVGALAFLGLIADPGLQYVGQRTFLTSGRNTSLIGRIATLRIVLALFAVVLVAAVLALAQTSLSWLVLLYGLTLIPSALSLAWVYTASERMRVVALGNAANALLYTCWVFFFVTSSGDLFLVPLGLYVAIVAALVVQYALAPRDWRRCRARPTFRWGLSTLRESLPIGFSFLLSQTLVWVDTFLLAVLMSLQAVGIYHAAYRWILLVLALTSFFPQALFPGLVEGGGSPRGVRIMEDAIRLILTVGIVAALTLYGASNFLVGSVFGRGYEQAEVVLGILAVLVPFAMHNALVGHYLNARHREIRTLQITAVVVVINVVLNLLLIPKAGVAGAALALVLTEMSCAVLCFVAAHRLGIQIWRTYGTAFLGFGCAAVVLGVFREAPWLAALMGAVVFFLVLALRGDLSRNRLRQYHDVFWRRHDAAEGPGRVS